MRPARSLLFVPGNRQKLLDKAPTLPTDAVILDLEDSVPVAEKDNARAMVQEYILTMGDKGVWVRVNGTVSGQLENDLDAIVGIAGLDGIMLPKPESAAEILEVDQMLRVREEAKGIPVGQIEIIAQVESARGVLFAYEMASAADRVTSLCFAGAQDGDLMTDIGCAWSIDGPELMYARQHTLIACRAARIDYPLDGVFANINDDEGFAHDTDLSRRLGYRGRTVIHPKQIEPANRLYSPSPAEVEYYRRVLEAFEAAVAEGAALTTLDGKMIDYAMAANARRVIAQADALGVTATSG